ncbi:hypothetical protein C8C76_12447 [Halanaerobium saccharolyticum]|jgi:hypothetical protein|uniref:HepT-like domain-containing protein n=1 Tax=Halanaerobium saccharolyticum TaxID=43595 RepID=A0A2T5RHV4_9FIRM|nr:hypothetical protein [Halanaerobium saccharolyticum]PTV96848.1 hypothetical protein C8C76_12447 [Halanaerobium saccharolyticum]
MTERGILTFIAKIEDELTELDQLKDRIQTVWGKYKINGDEFYLDSVALNLHGLYSGFEKIFLEVAKEIDENIPEGSSWHKELLDQMALKIKNLRPALISKESRDILDEYRAFRHIVRNVYANKYSDKKISILLDNFSNEYSKVKKEIQDFLNFLEEDID